MFNKLCKLNFKFENYQSKAPEWGAFLIYVISHIVLCIYHEPWFDECVAWMIAKCTGVKDLIFYVPHYEGHPPLWHLLLKIFASCNVDFHIALSVCVIVFSSISVYLIIFKSPFLRVIRLAIPFTYFIYYQYSVISRPYCMMMLAFCLLAIFYKKRNEKPGLYVVMLLFLCLTSAYGILLACGMSIAWIIEIISECVKTKGTRFGSAMLGTIKDRRCWWLFFLLLWAIFIVCLIVPDKGSFAAESQIIHRRTNVVNNLIYCFLSNIPDTFCYDVFGETGSSLLIVSFLGLLINVLIFIYGKTKGTVVLFFAPFIMHELFASMVYFYLHHSGIIQLFLGFWLWVSLESKTQRSLSEVIQDANIKANVFKLMEKRKELLRFSAILLIIYAMTMSIYFSIKSSLGDLYMPYSSGKSVAEFIKENNLERYKIMGGFTKTDEGTYIRKTELYTMFPYFDKQILSYQAFGMDGNYNIHVTLSEEETEKEYEKWRQIGEPDIIVGEIPFYDIFIDSDTDIRKDYKYVYSDISNMMWKDTSGQSSIGVYMRTDLADELGFEAIPKPMIVNINR